MPDALDREQTVLDLLVEALPHLRGGLAAASAEFTARLVYENLGLDAASVVSATDGVLAYIGEGDDHHLVGYPNLTEITKRALATGKPDTATDRAGIGCPVAACPITAVTIAPFVVRGNVVGALKLYRSGGRAMEERDERVAVGLARVFSVYLEVAELDARAALVRQAELDALRAQISPHFLFNTLTTIAALTRTDPNRAHDLIVDFAQYFRDTLAHRGDFVALDDELATVERYLGFERARFGDGLHVEFAIDPRARAVPVPVFAVQPLVENAIAHGLKARHGRGTIRIAAHPRDDGIEISVSDDGSGIAADRLQHLLQRGTGSGLGMGLSNVHQRLTGAYGPSSGLQVASEREGGTTVAFWIPLRGPAA
jgi:LytS/YehU family sensor histidine kinase